jgi:DNA-binding CsgD family transcriptional regulator/PAS domain-containing protein
MRDAVDAAYVTIALASTNDTYGRFAAQTAWDPEQLRVLQTDYGFDDIPGLKAAVEGDIDTPLSTLSNMSEKDLQQTAFYRNWAQPQGLREACMTKFVHTSDRIGLLGCTTRMSRDAISSDERRFLALLSPHLRRASLIGDLLDQARVEALLYRETLQNLAAPIVLTSAGGDIIYANQSAEGMLSAHSALTSKDGVLGTRNAFASRALLEAIADASRGDDSLGSRGIGLPITAAGQAPAVAYVLPLAEGTARAAFLPAAAAVFISTTISASPLPEAVLITLFDLTPAEARVLLKVGSGMSSGATSLSLGISENTLKTHLNRIYAKTGTGRQADLVKLIADIGTPLGIHASAPIARRETPA